MDNMKEEITSIIWNSFPKFSNILYCEICHIRDRTLLDVCVSVCPCAWVHVCVHSENKMPRLSFAASTFGDTFLMIFLHLSNKETNLGIFETIS